MVFVVGKAVLTIALILTVTSKKPWRIHRGCGRRCIECDEAWSFVYAKNRNVAYATAAPPGSGDVWTWSAIDADSKLVVSYLVGLRGEAWALEFMDDLRSRLEDRPQITTDGLAAYVRRSKAPSVVTWTSRRSSSSTRRLGR
ncbi:MAG: hypothetical protein OXU77_19240 [Gammaproteobacteria bacterium]|nr:hypothetical protein [Gammaproteobacteria bacterium]